MFTKALFFAILFCTSLSVVFAQKQTVYFFKNNGKEVKIRDSADYVRVFREPDSGSVMYNVSEFFLNGTPKLTGKSSKTEHLTLQEKCTAFYPSGKVKEIATYKNGSCIGEMTCYYPNGVIYALKKYPNTIEHRNDDGMPDKEYLTITCNDSTGKPWVTNGNGHYIGYSNDFKNIEEEGDIKDSLQTGTWKGNNNDKKDWLTFEENYNHGKLITGTAKSNDGVVSTYTKRGTSPTYIGGEQAFARFLGNNIVYPPEAKKHNIQGKVFLSFVVDKNGKLTDIKVTRSVSPDIDAEAVRVISESPKWKPGVLFGRTVRVQYVVPLNFSLRD